MGKSERPYHAWETMMIGEWVAQTFPTARWVTNVRLGTLQPRNDHGQFSQGELELLGVWRRRVDAIVYLPDRLLLVEAVLRSHPGKLSVLKLYEALARQTPELADFQALPIQLVLLYCVEDPVLNELARQQGILCVQYVPTFFDAWFATLRRREQQASRST